MRPGADVWHLLRAAVLVVGDPPLTFHFALTNGDTVTRALRMLSVEGKQVGMLAVAGVPLETPPVPGDRYQVPEGLRRQAEAGLEFACRLVALEHVTTHEIISTRPSLGLHCSEASQMDALEGTPVDLPGRNATMVGTGQAGLNRAGFCGGSVSWFRPR